MEYLRIRNWERYQFKRYDKDNDGPHPWVKLHTLLLNDDKFWLLPVPAQLQFVKLLLVAAANRGHHFLHDEEYLRQSLRLKAEEELYVDLLLEQRFLERERDRTKKPETPKKPAPAREEKPEGRKLQPQQQLFELCVELGLKGERPTPSKVKQHCIVAAKMLQEQPFEYWERAARSMSRLYPFSKGNPWDILTLHNKAHLALAEAPKSDGPADDDGFTPVDKDNEKPDWLVRQEAGYQW